jgi:hypothetical protein
LRFASFAVINLRVDLHLLECARAGRTAQKNGLWAVFVLCLVFCGCFPPCQGGQPTSLITRFARQIGRSDCPP